MAEDIPIEKLYSHPIVQELLERLNKPKDLENVTIPYIKKSKILMSPGVWNNYYYSPESIRDAYLKTNWDNKETRSLFLDHLDKNSREWIGEVINPQMSGEDLVGDLVIVDKPMAQKLEYGAKLGISPKVHGEEDNNNMISFLFDNFSIVVNPAVKTAYINNMEVNEKMAEIKPVEAELETPKVVIVETPEPQKEEPKLPEVVKIEETCDELIDTLSEIVVKNGVGDIAKKAKEIRKEGELWSEAIKRAAKMFSEAEEELAKKCVVKTAEPEPKPVEEVKKPEEEVKMADSDVVSQIVKLAELLQRKKYPYPEPIKEEVVVVDKKMEEQKVEEVKMEKEMQEKINELSEKVNKLTMKLNEPDKLSIKTEELSVLTSEELVCREPDRAMLNVLRRL